ncbi:14637_t:CDS:2 [Gigaspora margarita]|uniref:14637_t:CDS:1 n=1 Tax=Gigaspora margarita TaxID=4874 RepID=A0ABN7WIX6_GIGMA|nr:14637_t:CDS:2 [Gigaspora margarita]
MALSLCPCGGLGWQSHLRTWSLLAIPKHNGLWIDKYNKGCKYLLKLIGDENAEKKLLDCANNYVVDNSIKKVIKDKRKMQ